MGGVPGTHQTRYLGLDIGDKRVGVAVSDPLALLAQPVLTLRRGNPRDDMRSLRRLLRRHECAAIVAGLPLHLSGEAGSQAIKAQRFARELGEMCGVPVHLWDEQLTTAEAHALLYRAGHPRAEHRALVDQVAAVLILQGFLDARRPAASTSPPPDGEV